MHLIPQLAGFAPELIIFDKDGTLIDFHAMWGGWAIELARRLERNTGRPITGRLFEVMDFDPDAGRIMPDGHLAITPTSELQRLTTEVLQATGLSTQAVEAAMAAAWHIPDPVALAQPITDLALLFSTLRAQDAKIAIATSDDRAPTETLLIEMKVAPLVDTLICADDGLPIKPAPDMVLTICGRLDISPTKTVMVGDNVPDLQMGRAAGVGLTIGVLSGLSSAEALADYADILLPSVRELIQG
jgi:HAD superfamily hydrolase (TIGR01549 family)